MEGMKTEPVARRPDETPQSGRSRRRLSLSKAYPDSARPCNRYRRDSRTAPFTGRESAGLPRTLDLIDFAIALFAAVR